MIWRWCICSKEMEKRELCAIFVLYWALDICIHTHTHLYLCTHDVRTKCFRFRRIKDSVHDEITKRIFNSTCETFCSGTNKPKIKCHFHEWCHDLYNGFLTALTLQILQSGFLKKKMTRTWKFWSISDTEDYHDI